MNKHTVDTITAALHDLDPAPATALTEVERARAEERFARILSAPGPSPDRVTAKPDRRRRRWGRLLVPAGLAAAAAVVVPGLFLGGGSAYGSWTPTPEPLSAVDAAAAATTCRTTLEMSDQNARVPIAERRGGWTYVLIDNTMGEGFCLLPNDLVGQHVPAGRGAFFGGYNPGADVVDVPTPAHDDIVEVESMEGSTDEGYFSLTQGHVGSDVAGVRVHRASGPDVEASVEDGRFAAWWPESNPGRTKAWSYTITLADGSTRHGVMSGHLDSGRG